ncbi:leucyl aminopeptidase [Endobacter medicaginis]|uniref:Probable cytosol aminopeptidase n=2 Tax=Endobacter medicaginis TaxID=1181271 RepID=A0A839V3R3_9PROT|nr:leucyl aminopeptidase [Endobacter medicaginis]MBB3174212.1 leucyl aminopeptidase [Endobacter medicaginis]MCX5474256.1 leucyl aminopeptidase [Endobacter medicaginis]
MLDIRFAAPPLPSAEGEEAYGVALLLSADGPKPPGFEALDAATGGALSRAIAAAQFKGTAGKTLSLLAPAPGLARVIAVGLGAQGELDAAAAERAGGIAAASLADTARAVIVAEAVPSALAVSVATGAALRHYRFDRYRTRESAEDKPRLAAITIHTAEPDHATTAWAAAQAVVRGAFITRDLVSEPANILTPAVFAERIAALSELGLEIEVLDTAAMRELGFGALLGVAQGSDNPPKLVVIRHRGGPDPEAAPVAFIGKGVTFDSGGISIKPAGGMEEMKTDMAGAGAVVGLMAALAGRGAKVNAVGLVGLVENMLSGNAQRPGDVVTSASGQTIEVINTDAEGRLVLADVLWYAQERFKPKLMVDLATLTGAIVVSLGYEHAGLFATDDTLAEQLAASGRATGEKLWRMPLGEAYDKQIRSDIADMKNIGGRPGGAITAAQFLKRFVRSTPWAHLDIAGTAWGNKDVATAPKGATGFGVRLLDRFVADHHEG